MQGIGLPWIGEPAFLAHEATGTVASPPILGQVGGALPGKIWGAYLAKCEGALLRETGEAYLDKRWGFKTQSLSVISEYGLAKKGGLTWPRIGGGLLGQL